MAKGVFKSIEAVCKHVKKDLDTPNPDPKKLDHTKVSILYACNASGKTRLSTLFQDKNIENVLCYNAYFEDLFHWNNNEFILTVSTKLWIFKIIEDEGLDRQIIDTFQKLTGSKLEPVFNWSKGYVEFGIHAASDEHFERIKISRGEESVFIWAVFYTILDTAIDALNEKSDDDTETNFDNIQYIVIDDPVSSMDDTRIITVALELAKLISKSKNQLKFLITTHHALFFNVLFNARGRSWDRKNYILSKSGVDFILKPQGNDSPFAYHHVAMAEIEKAINDNDIKKYHFNIFRALLEKTANFMGYDHWKKCLEGGEHREAFTKIIDHYSHNKLSDLEYRDITDDEKDEFKAAFLFFMNEYKWSKKTNG